jgi:hypothetical protein
MPRKATDGESASYPAVVAAKPYGPTPIEKLGCVGHIQKLMGTRLKNLKKKYDKKDQLSDGKPLRGRGRLTNAAINEIQLYYGLAIRRNASITQKKLKKQCGLNTFTCPPQMKSLNMVYARREKTVGASSRKQS